MDTPFVETLLVLPDTLRRKPGEKEKTFAK